MILPFACRCGRSFHTAWRLGRHAAHRHPNDSAYPAPLCPFCDDPAEFRVAGGLDGAYAGAAWVCTTCRAWTPTIGGSAAPKHELTCEGHRS